MGHPTWPSLPQGSCFPRGNVLGKGAVWAEVLRHHGLLGSLHMSTWLAHCKRTACGETRPGLCSLLGLSMEGYGDLLVLPMHLSSCTCPDYKAFLFTSGSAFRAGLGRPTVPCMVMRESWSCFSALPMGYSGISRPQVMLGPPWLSNWYRCKGGLLSVW